jgi:P4 family phage/plasmid primase-like protien
MIQVLGLRDYVYKEQPRKRETFFNNGWRFQRVEEVFEQSKLDALIAQVPERERFNLYFTVADCYEEAGRKLKEQWAIPFDIDGLELTEGSEHEQAALAARTAGEAIGVPYEEMGVVFTGNGVQFFILLDQPIIDDGFFERTRDHYGVLAARIQNLLNERAIKGKVDTSVWSRGRLMRLALTENRKPNRPTRTARLLNGPPVARHFDIVEESGVMEIKEAHVMTDVALKNYPKPDTKAICMGCKFLAHCKTEPAKVSEPQWYAMLSITSRLDDGRELSHEYSQGHASYNHYETENKIDQALASAGPRTCASIGSLFEGCTQCEYHGKVTSPIMIKGDDYIASADFGFRERKITKDRIVPGAPVFQDLIKTFAQEHPYKSVSDTDTIHIYNGRYWQGMEDPFVRQWMYAKVRHHPSAAEMREFITQLKAENVVKLEWFHVQAYGKLNFTNCVLDLKTMETTPHDPAYGFFNVLPFPYDARATAPRWEKFLLEIMDSDAEMAELLKEYGGYAISGDPCWYQKAMVLLGDGANGKSVFMEILGEVVGPEFHSAVPLQSLEHDTLRYQLVNKLFNYSEETSVRALADSSMFKTMVSGGMMTVKQLYVQPYQVHNRAKIIMAANDMPRTNDNTYGLYRRLIIVPFNVKFEYGSEKHDPYIKDKLREELPGICNSLIAAYQRFKEKRIMSGDSKVAQVIEMYKTESDSVKLFLDTCVEFEGEQDIKFSEFYEDYRIACDKLGRKSLGSTEFARQLYRNKPDIKRSSKRINGAMTRVVSGVKINKNF